MPRALVRFEHLVDPSTEFLLRLEEIEDVVPSPLINAQASGNSVADEISSEIEKRLEHWGTPSILRIVDVDADSNTFDPDSAYDERERAIRAIRIRRGQPAFRAALLKAYGGRCVITGLQSWMSWRQPTSFPIWVRLRTMFAMASLCDQICTPYSIATYLHFTPRRD